MMSFTQRAYFHKVIVQKGLEDSFLETFLYVAVEGNTTSLKII